MHHYTSSLPQSIKIKKIIQENFKTKTFITDVNLKAKPGQFVMIWIADNAEKPFSLTTSSPLSFTAMDVGKFSHHLNTKVKAGDTIWYRGPFGDGHFKIKKGPKFLIAGGCGCVPLYHLALRIKEKEGSKNTKIIIGAKVKKELLFVEKFRRLGFKVLICTDDGSLGQKGYTTQILEKVLAKQKVACVYSCGPEAMLKNIALICGNYKTKFQLSLEALVKCGFGICGSCARGGKLVCKDGPVFDSWVE
jgi:dihydroorotate dehydrogenase electron transfer subunit